MKLALSPTTFEGKMVSIPMFASPVTMDVDVKFGLDGLIPQLEVMQ